jgi:hypothetical protein
MIFGAGTCTGASPSEAADGRLNSSKISATKNIDMAAPTPFSFVTESTIKHEEVSVDWGIFHRLPTPTCHIVNPDRAASRRHHSTHEAKASIEDMRERYAAERRPRESGLFAFRVESTSERFHVHRRH